MEGAWRLYAEHIDGLYPPVQRLALHLKDQETVHFEEHADLEAVLSKNRTTTLTAWFAYNRQNTDGHHLTYQQFPEHFTFDRSKRVWTKRRDNRFSVGRVYMASPGTCSSVLNGLSQICRFALTVHYQNVGAC